MWSFNLSNLKCPYEDSLLFLVEYRSFLLSNLRGILRNGVLLALLNWLAVILSHFGVFNQFEQVK